MIVSAHRSSKSCDKIMKMKSVLVLFSLLNYAASQTDNRDKCICENITKLNEDALLGGPCITPGGEQGECVSIDDCPGLANLFANPIKGSKEFLDQFQCGGKSFISPDVCCISGWNYTNYGKGLSDRRYCGYQHTDDYFYTGNTTSIDEFPWLAAIVRTDKEIIVSHGSLISNRYILTSAYYFDSLRSYRGLRVVLGKYNGDNTTSCVDHGAYGLECTEVQEFGIEEAILHPFFYAYEFDIGLIRLNKTVSYTDYIRPICLPTQGTKFAEVGETLYATGWGGKSVDVSAPVKKKVKLILVTFEECKKILRLYSSTYHICTFGLENITKYGYIDDYFDTGAPVMYSYRNQWQIEGIVAHGSGYYSANPKIHTRVSPFIDWIKQHIRP